MLVVFAFALYLFAPKPFLFLVGEEYPATFLMEKRVEITYSKLAECSRPKLIRVEDAEKNLIPWKGIFERKEVFGIFENSTGECAGYTFRLRFDVGDVSSLKTCFSLAEVQPLIVMLLDKTRIPKIALYSVDTDSYEKSTAGIVKKWWEYVSTDIPRAFIESSNFRHLLGEGEKGLSDFFKTFETLPEKFMEGFQSEPKQ